MARNPAIASSGKRFPKRIRRHEEEIRQLRLREIGGGAALVTIAPSNYPKKHMADYVCTGTDDQNTLAQALSDGWTHLLLLPGDFYFTGAPYQYLSDVGLPDTTWVGIQGLGRVSVVHIEGADAVAFYPGFNDTAGGEISNLAFVNKSDGADCVIEAGYSDVSPRVFLKDLYFETPDDTNGYATAILSDGNVTMENITFGFFRTLNGSGWMAISPGANDIIRNVTCTDFHGGEVIDAHGRTGTLILNCIFTGNECVDAAIDLSSSTDCLLQGCTITGTTGGAVDVDTTSATGLRGVPGDNLIGVLT